MAPFLREVRRFRPDVVQVHESDGALAALAAEDPGLALEPAPLCALLQVSYWRGVSCGPRRFAFEGECWGVRACASWRFAGSRRRFSIVLGCLTAWLADRVLAPSAVTADELRRDYGASEVSVVPNATAPAARESSPVSADRERSTALFVGRLRVRKGLEVALHALGVVSEQAPEARLMIAGDGEHRPRLERLVRELDLSERVRFLGRDAARGSAG